MAFLGSSRLICSHKSNDMKGVLDAATGFLFIQLLTMSEVQNDLLVNGYVREQAHRAIPSEIIQVIFKWYHITFFIQYYNESVAGIMNPQKTMVKCWKSRGFHSLCSCYGSVIMPSFDNDIIYEYTIKISLSFSSQWYWDM